jgi:hypothetical protein
MKELGGDDSSALLSLMAGYRYQPPDGGLFLRLQAGPLYLARRSRVLPMAGAGAGWSF